MSPTKKKKHEDSRPAKKRQRSPSPEPSLGATPSDYDSTQTSNAKGLQRLLTTLWFILISYEYLNDDNDPTKFIRQQTADILESFSRYGGSIEMVMMRKTISAIMISGIVTTIAGNKIILSPAYSKIRSLIMTPVQNLGRTIGVDTTRPTDDTPSTSTKAKPDEPIPSTDDPEDELTNDDINNLIKMIPDPTERASAESRLKTAKDRYENAATALKTARDKSSSNDPNNAVGQALLKQVNAINSLVDELAKKGNETQAVTIDDTGRSHDGAIRFLRIKSFIEISALTGTLSSATEYIEVMNQQGQIIRKAANAHQVATAMNSLDMLGYQNSAARIWVEHKKAMIKAEWSTENIESCNIAHSFFVNEVLLTWRQFGRDAALNLDDRVREIVAYETENPDTPGRQCFKWGMRFMNLAINIKQAAQITHNNLTLNTPPSIPKSDPNPNPFQNPRATSPAFFVNQKSNKPGYNKAARKKMQEDGICCFYNIKTCRENGDHGKWKHICGKCGDKHPGIDCTK